MKDHPNEELNFSINLLKNNRIDCLKRITNGEKDGFLLPSSGDATVGRLVKTFITIDTLFDKSKNILINDEPQVLCKYQLSSNCSVYKNEILSQDHDLKNLVSLADELEKLRKDQDFSDFKLIAPCGRRLFAHKNILSARSPVFSSMLQNNMKEKADGFVKIQDICFEALKEMLNFMYCGRVYNLDHEVVCDLLAAAEKYEITNLKNECQKFLVKNLTKQSALLTLKLSQTYDMVDIQPEVNAF